MTRKKGPSIYPLHSVRLSFERNSFNIHVKTSCPKLKEFDFQVPGELKERLKLEDKMREIDWRAATDVSQNNLIAKYLRHPLGNYTSYGIIAPQELSQVMEILLHEALGEQGYSITGKDGDEYFKRIKIN